MLYYDDRIQYYDDRLEHHGVKGMKWGKRQYRKAAREGVKAQKLSEKTGHKKKIAESNSRIIDHKLKKETYNVEKLKLKNDYKGSNRTSKKLAKKTKQLEKTKGYKAMRDEKVRSTTKAHNTALAKREAAIQKAVKADVTIKRRDVLANAKVAGIKAIAEIVDKRKKAKK